MMKSRIAAAALAASLAATPALAHPGVTQTASFESEHTSFKDGGSCSLQATSAKGLHLYLLSGKTGYSGIIISGYDWHSFHKGTEGAVVVYNQVGGKLVKAQSEMGQLVHDKDTGGARMMFTMSTQMLALLDAGPFPAIGIMKGQNNQVERDAVLIFKPHSVSVQFFVNCQEAIR